MATDRQNAEAVNENGRGTTTTTKEGIIVPVTTTTNATEAARVAANNATDAAVNAARTASVNVNSYLDTYTRVVNTTLQANQSFYLAWLGSAFRLQNYSLNVMRQFVEEATRPETVEALRNGQTFTANVARWTVNETIEAQRESRKLVDEFSTVVKTGQEAAVQLAGANFRLLQSGINYRNGAL